MIPFDKAREIMLAKVRTLAHEQAGLSLAAGRVLAEDVVADRDMPPRDLSAMDGYACRKEDLGGPLEVIETVPAGSSPARTIGTGQCAKIMTGAPVPDGADTVVMVEHTTEQDGVVAVSVPSSRTNIRCRGEEVAKGTIVLTAGTPIGPSQIAVLASVGCDPVPVAARPCVGVVATGNELVEPSRKPEDFRIRNSNSYQLCAQIERAGCIAEYFGIAGDSPEQTREMIVNAMKTSDVVLLSGGVSIGDYDFVPDVLRSLGVDLLFERVAVQPGKPTVFGVTEDRYFLGMPGNPVSTFVIFEMLVRPFLCRMMGYEYEPRRTRASLAETLTRRKTERLSFQPAELSPDGVLAGVPYRGSGHIHAYTNANAIVAFPPGVGELEKGTDVEAILLT